MIFAPIHHIFAPLADRKQCRLALRLLCHPLRWQSGKSVEMLRGEIASRFPGQSVTLFASGREALFALLRALELPPHSAIVVQGYTCVVVPNAITAAGHTPVYADIDPETLNLTPETVEPLITPHTRAVICQHTFGIPADTEALRALCDRHSILLIEDCAHVIPDEQGPAGIAARSDAVFLSFGRDKAISGVTGGAVLCRNAVLAEKFKAQEETARDLPRALIGRLLLYPLLYCVSRPLYGIGIGKALLWLAARCRLLIPVVTREEKTGRMSSGLHRIPNACAALACEQLVRLESLNAHRRTLTQFYRAALHERGIPILHGIREDLPLQKFPLFVSSADTVRARLKRHSIHLDDGWTGCVICPRTADVAAARYAYGGDPRAETAASSILSLPTHPLTTSQQCATAIDKLKKYV